MLISYIVKRIKFSALSDYYYGDDTFKSFIKAVYQDGDENEKITASDVAEWEKKFGKKLNW